MAKTNQNPPLTQNENRGKTVLFRILAFFLAAACVAAFFLPYNYFFNELDIQKQSLYQILMALIQSEHRLFGVIPTLTNFSLLGISASVALYGFTLALLLAFLISFIALVARKHTEGLLKIATFLFTWGSALYSISILVVSSYIVTYSIGFDLFSLVLAIFGAVLYFVLMLITLRKAAWLQGLLFSLSVLAAGLVLLSVTHKGDLVSDMVANKKFEWMLLGAIAVLLFCLLLSSSILWLENAGAAYTQLCSVILLLASIFVVAYLNYASGMGNNTQLLFAIFAGVVCLVELGFCVLNIYFANKKQYRKDVREFLEMLSQNETEQSTETEKQTETQPCECIADTTEAPEEEDETELAEIEACFADKGPDSFIDTLTDAERKEFAKLYILKKGVEESDIPTYEVGGDNKVFFRKVFIFIGEHRDNISEALMDKIYDFTNN